MNNEITTIDDILDYEASHSEQVIDVNEKLIKLVIFKLNDHYYAFYGSHVKEILPQGSMVFYVPGCPASLNGVINLRGEIESVIDIRELLQLSTEQMSAQTILLAQTDQMKSGIKVAEVIDVVDIPESEIIEAPDNLSETLKNYVSHALKFNEELITILNLEKLFNDYLQGLG